MVKVTPIDVDEETPDGFSEHLIEIYKSQCLKSFRRLGRNGLRKLDRNYAAKYRKFTTKRKKMHKNNRSQASIELEEEKYRKDVFDQLQQDLGISFDLGDRETRNVELSRILVFYLGRAQSPGRFEQNIIRRLLHSYATIKVSNDDYSWNGLCCELLSTDMFEKLYDNLGKKPSYLIHIVRKNPNLFFRNQWLDSLLRFMIDCVPYDMCHKMFSEVRDENKRTLFFDQRVSVDIWKKLYQDRAADRNRAVDDAVKDLYAALSIKDKSSQTAWDCNTEVVADLLAMFPTPEGNHLEIGNAGHTPLNMVMENMKPKLYWMKEQTENSLDAHKSAIVYGTESSERVENEDQCNAALVPALIFYLRQGQEPGKYGRNQIRMHQSRLKCREDTIEYHKGTSQKYILEGHFHNVSWNDLCSELLKTDGIFNQFCNKLANDPSVLSDMLRNSPEFLFKLDRLNRMLRNLIDRKPYEECHTLLSEVRDGKGRTLLFNPLVGVDIWKNLYRNRDTDERDAGKDFYELLSIKDKSSLQNACHANAEVVAELLAMFTPPERNSQLLTILNAEDSTGHTPLDMAKGNTRLKLDWLKEQAERNRYILYNAPEIIIASATDQRKGAEEEAASIQTAFQKIFPTDNITSQSTIKKEGIIELIRNKAAKRPSALIVILMAHGEVGAIRESTGKGIIPLHEIEKAMCNCRLRNTLKILIVQCCQGRDAASQVFNEPRPQSASVQVDSPTNADSRPPTKNLAAFVPSEGPDFLTLMSCMPGESADRNLFIPTLAEAIKEAGSDTNIIQVFQNTHTKMSSEGKLQTPTVQGSPKADIVPKAGFYKQLMSDKQCWVLPTGSLNGFVLEPRSI